MSGDNDAKVFELIDKLQSRVEKLEADAIRHKSETQAVFLCLRDATKMDSKLLLDAFTFYVKECHQKHLERIEDVSPWWAATMDKRKPDELP